MGGRPSTVVLPGPFWVCAPAFSRSGSRQRAFTFQVFSIPGLVTRTSTRPALSGQAISIARVRVEELTCRRLLLAALRTPLEDRDRVHAPTLGRRHGPLYVRNPGGVVPIRRPTDAQPADPHPTAPTHDTAISLQNARFAYWPDRLRRRPHGFEFRWGRHLEPRRRRLLCRRFAAGLAAGQEAETRFGADLVSRE